MVEKMSANLRILLRLPNWLGDAVMASVAFERLKADFPNASFTLVGSKAACEIYSRDSSVKRIFIDETKNKRDENLGFWAKTRLAKTIKFAQKVGKHDIAIAFTNSFFSGVFLYFTRSTLRVGYSRNARFLFFNKKVRFVKGIHQVESYLNLALETSPLGMQCSEIADFVECTDTKSANIPQNPQNSHSHTASAKSLDSENGNLESNKSVESSLRESKANEAIQKVDCHDLQCKSRNDRKIESSDLQNCNKNNLHEVQQPQGATSPFKPPCPPLKRNESGEATHQNKMNENEIAEQTKNSENEAEQKEKDSSKNENLNSIKKFNNDTPSPTIPPLKLISRPINYPHLGDKICVGISPGAAFGGAKRWEEKYFLEVIEYYLGKNYSVFVFGIPSEVGDLQGLLDLYIKDNPNFHNLIGKTSIHQLCDFIANMNLFITNDSGAMHIAAAFNVPLVAIFGATNAKETSPWYGKNLKNQFSEDSTPKAILLNKNLPCSPCKKHECPLKHHNCMKLITPDEVIRNADWLLFKHR